MQSKLWKLRLTCILTSRLRTFAKHSNEKQRQWKRNIRNCTSSGGKIKKRGKDKRWNALKNDVCTPSLDWIWWLITRWWPFSSYFGHKMSQIRKMRSITKLFFGTHKISVKFVVGWVNDSQIMVTNDIFSKFWPTEDRYYTVRGIRSNHLRLSNNCPPQIWSGLCDQYFSSSIGLKSDPSGPKWNHFCRLIQ